MEVYEPKFSVVMQELRGEISLGLQCAGCPYGCKGCSYKDFEKNGRVKITLSEFIEELDRNEGCITAVVWMGGEWQDDFAEFLSVAKQRGLKTCLYTGIEDFRELPDNVLSDLDFCKTGKWTGIPINNKESNQRFWDVKTGKDLTEVFYQKQGAINVC